MSNVEANYQYSNAVGCAVMWQHIISISEGVRYNRVTLSIHLRCAIKEKDTIFLTFTYNVQQEPTYKKPSFGNQPVLLLIQGCYFQEQPEKFLKSVHKKHLIKYFLFLFFQLFCNSLFHFCCT